MKVIDPFEHDDLIEQMKHNYGFDLKKDFKKCRLSQDEFFFMLQDLSLLRHHDRVITRINPFEVHKTRHRDETRNINASGAYRLISLSDGTKIIPFHLYHKTSGKKPKKDLTESEKKTCKKMVKDAYQQSKGG